MGPERCLAIVGLTRRPEGRRRDRPRSRRPRSRLQRHRRTRDRLGLAAGAVRRAVPAQRAVGRGLRGRHARDRHRLDAPARPRRRARPDAPPRPGGVGRTRPRLQPPVARLSDRVEPVHRPTSSVSPPTRRDARTLADAQVGRQPAHRRARRDDQPPARRRRRPCAVSRRRRRGRSGWRRSRARPRPSTRTAGWPAARSSGRRRHDRARR